MTHKLMTLAEALASGKPFKKPSWVSYIDPNNRAIGSAGLFDDDFFDECWQVQEEPKLPMRVWTNAKCEILITSEIPTQWKDDLCWVDITESLAKALAPYLKEEK